MKIVKVKNYEEMSKKAATFIASQVTIKPDCVLGLATGSSPVGTYKKLIEANDYEAITLLAEKYVSEVM